MPFLFLLIRGGLKAMGGPNEPAFAVLDFRADNGRGSGSNGVASDSERSQAISRFGGAEPPGGSATLRLALIETRGHVTQRSRWLCRSQILQQALPIRRAALLSQLELALEQLDLQLETDNAAHEPILVAFGDLCEV